MILNFCEPISFVWPSSDRLSARCLFGPILSWSDADNAFPLLRSYPSNWDTGSGQNAFTKAFCSSESKTADGSFTWPRADLLNEGGCRMRAINEIGKKRRIDAAPARRTIVEAREVADFRKSIPVKDRERASKAYIGSDDDAGFCHHQATSLASSSSRSHGCIPQNDAGA